MGWPVSPLGLLRRDLVALAENGNGFQIASAARLWRPIGWEV